MISVSISGPAYILQLRLVYYTVVLLFHYICILMGLTHSVHSRKAQVQAACTCIHKVATALPKALSYAELGHIPQYSANETREQLAGLCNQM